MTIRSHIKLIVAAILGIAAIVIAVLLLLPGKLEMQDYHSLYNQGEYAKCISLLEKELDGKPDWTEARKLLIEAQLAEGLPVAALENLVIVLDEGDLVLTDKVKQALLASDKSLDGVNILQAHLERTPNSGQARLLQTELQLHSHKLTDAAINLAVLASQDISTYRLEDLFVTYPFEDCLTALERASELYPNSVRLKEIKLHLGFKNDKPQLVVTACKDLGENLTSELLSQVKEFLNKTRIQSTIPQAIELALFLQDQQWLADLITSSSNPIGILSNLTSEGEAWEIALDLVSSQYSSQQLVEIVCRGLLSQDVDEIAVVQALKDNFPEEIEEQLAMLVGLHPHFSNNKWILATDPAAFNHLHEFVEDHENFSLYYGAYLLSIGEAADAKELLEPLKQNSSYANFVSDMLQSNIVQVSEVDYHYPGNKFFSHLYIIALEDGPALYYQQGDIVYKYIQQTRGLEKVNTLPHRENLIWSIEGKYAYQYLQEHEKITFIIYDSNLNILEKIEIDSESEIEDYDHGGLIGYGGYVFNFHWTNNNKFVISHRGLVYDCENRIYLDYSREKHAIPEEWKYISDSYMVFPAAFEKNNYRMRQLTDYLLVLDKVDSQGQIVEMLPFYWVNTWDIMPFENFWDYE